MAKKIAKKTVVLLLSGGPDSATLAKLIASESKKAKPTAISAIYLRSGHPSDSKEIKAADRIMKEVGGKLEIIDIKDLVRSLGGDRVLIHSQAAILPFGNGMVLAMAMAYALKTRADQIAVGIHADDVQESSEYSREFFDMIQRAAKFGHPSAPTIETPLIGMTKVEVIKLGHKLGVNYSATWSCIRGENDHCGQCGACRARRRAFNLAGIEDETNYVTEPLALETAVH